MTHESQHNDAQAEHAGPSAGTDAPTGTTGRATSPGQTAGLPGANADPRTEVVSEDETAPTTLMGEAAES
jgi:hypothetical protein